MMRAMNRVAAVGLTLLALLAVVAHLAAARQLQLLQEAASQPLRQPDSPFDKMVCVLILGPSTPKHLAADRAPA
jgi:hypothetical protein